MGHSWISIVGWMTLGGSVALAWWKGSWAERYGALLLLGSNLVSDLAMAVCFPHTPELFLFVIDFLLAIGLLVLALRYSSLWLGVAMLLQSVALFTHALVLMDEGPSPYLWMILNDGLTQLMLGCIVAASLVSWRRRKRPPSKPAFYLVEDAPAL